MFMRTIDIDSLCKNLLSEDNLLDISGLKEYGEINPEFILKKDKEHQVYISFNDAQILCATHFLGKNEVQKNLSYELKRLLNYSNDYDFNFIEEKDSSQKIYLDKNDSLAKYLFRSGFRIVFEKKELNIQLNEKGKLFSGDVVLNINNENECSFALRTEDKFINSKLVPLSHKYILAEKSVFYCPSIGQHYAKLSEFEGIIPDSQMQLFLSMVVSVFPDVEINYKEYDSVKFEDLETSDALQFKSLDEDGTLKINYFPYLEGFPIEFIANARPKSVVFINDDLRRIEIRDLNYSFGNVLSMVAAKAGKSAIVEGNSMYLSSGDALDFLTQNLGFISRNFKLFGTDEIKKFKLKYATPKTNLKISSGIDYFATECEVDIEGQVFSFEEVLKIYEENNFIPLNDGSKAIVDEKFFSKLRRLLGKRDKNGEYKLSFFDLPLVESLIDSKVEGEVFEHGRKVYEGLNNIKDIELDLSGINATLRDYQLYGAKWMTYLAKNNMGGCLADDMGLGKTLQTITMLKQLNGNALIVVPKSLVANWQSEIEKFMPDTDVFIYYGSDRNFDEVSNHRLVITTYAMVRNDIENLCKINFDCIVFDEVQAIKNIQSQIAKAAMLLNGKHRFALSGTPMENNLLELYSIFRFLNPAMFGSAQDFTSRYVTPIQKNGDGEALADLGLRIKPFILRRLKNQVAKELPERSEQVIFVEMNEAQKVLYEKQRRFYKESIENSVSKQGFNKSTFLILQGLTELRQLATVPESKTEGDVEGAKWNILIENLCDVTASGHKCLVFSNFLTSIDEIANRLEKEGIGFVTMTGATSNRSEVVKKFQNDASCKVFLMTLKTGGVGLNLTQADYVFIVDPWWNTSAEQQAIDRTHRIGQTKNVFCYRFIAKNTIEEKIMELQKQKKDLFDSVISSDGQMMKKLSEEDINFILTEKRDL